MRGVRCDGAASGGGRRCWSRRSGSPLPAAAASGRDRRAPTSSATTSASPGREVLQARVDFAPGASFPRHKHPGEEIIYVTQGHARVSRSPASAGDAEGRRGAVRPRRRGARGARTSATKPAAELATYVLEKGKPLVVPAPSDRQPGRSEELDMTTRPPRQFDLTPPSDDQRHELESGPHRARSGTCCSSMAPRRRSAACSSTEKRDGRLHLPAVRAAVVQGRVEVRERHRLAELHHAVRRRPSAHDPRRPATAWSGPRSSAPAAARTRATSSPTARRRPASAIASIRCRSTSRPSGEPLPDKLGRGAPEGEAWAADARPFIENPAGLRDSRCVDRAHL